MRLNEKALFEIRMVSNLQTFGKNRFIFTLTKMDEEKNKYITHIYMYRGGKFIQITSTGTKNTNPKFSPSYRKLAFISDREEEKPQIYIYDFLREPQKLTAEKGNILDFVWKDEDTIYFVVSQTTKRKSPYAEKSDVKEIDHLFYKFDNVGYLNNLVFILKKVNLNDGNVETVRKFRRPLNNLRFYNGKLLFTSNMDRNWDLSLYNYIYEFDEESGKLRKLFRFRSFISAFEVFEDKIYFIANTYERGLADIPNFYIFDGSEVRKITSLERNPYNSLNSDARSGSGKMFKIDQKGSIYFKMTVGGRCGLFKLHDDNLNEVEFGDFSVEDFDLFPDGTIITVRSYFNHPTEIYMNGRKISKFNDRFVRKYRLQNPERLVFKSSDGKNIEGWVLKPYNKSKKKSGKLPAILEIHGGPRTAYGYAFMFEFHLLAHSGFYVMFSNPRGSDGYGFEFANEIVGDYGSRDFKDLMEFVNEVLKRYEDIDDERLGITGGSYGGFMTNWVISHTDSFRCAITQRSISNWISFYGTSDIGWLFGESEVGKTPLNNLDWYWEKSPLKYVENIKTPLLIIHSENDYRCPLEQAEQLFVHLRRLGREVSMVIFPQEGHELSRSGKPKHRVERLSYIKSWFEKYLG